MGVGTVVGASSGFAQQAAPSAAASAPGKAPRVPTRLFGRTGVNVSMLALGGIFDITSNQLVLQQALDWGVTYWDTAASYNNGNSELGIGMYFEKYPQARKNIFLVTKSGGGPDQLTKELNQSLERLKTDYIDLYFMHGLGDPARLDDSVKAWAQKAKADKKIRFFGFSTHGNMENCLQGAAKLGWIDGIMLKYDFRLMQTDPMKAAVDAARKAGIGLTAMKTQSKNPISTDTDADLKMGGHFIQRGFSQHQAKIKAVWENSRIASICSQMPNLTILQSNIAAALDKTSLTLEDHAALRQYAAETRTGHCAGCTDICETALNRQLPVGDVMRALMYQRSYGDRELARSVFQSMPEAARRNIASLDYSAAENACPNNLPIGKMMREAEVLFG